jgi:hypothetical protein
VIVAVPGELPITIPFAVILAIDGLLDDHGEEVFVGGSPHELHKRKVESPSQIVLSPRIDWPDVLIEKRAIKVATGKIRFISIGLK